MAAVDSSIVEAGGLVGYDVFKHKKSSKIYCMCRQGFYSHSIYISITRGPILNLLGGA